MTPEAPRFVGGAGRPRQGARRCGGGWSPLVRRPRGRVSSARPRAASRVRGVRPVDVGQDRAVDGPPFLPDRCDRHDAGHFRLRAADPMRLRAVPMSADDRISVARGARRPAGRRGRRVPGRRVRPGSRRRRGLGRGAARGLVRHPRSRSGSHHRTPGRVDASSAALWAGVLAAAAAGTGAYLEAARETGVRLGDRRRAHGLWMRARVGHCGGLVVATLEPRVTRAYLEVPAGLGGRRKGARFTPPGLPDPVPWSPPRACSSRPRGTIWGRPLFNHPGGLGAGLPSPLLSPWFWLLNGVPLASAAKRPGAAGGISSRSLLSPPRYGALLGPCRPRGGGRALVVPAGAIPLSVVRERRWRRSSRSSRGERSAAPSAGMVDSSLDEPSGRATTSA